MIRFGKQKADPVPKICRSCRQEMSESAELNRPSVRPDRQRNRQRDASPDPHPRGPPQTAFQMGRTGRVRRGPPGTLPRRPRSELGGLASRALQPRPETPGPQPPYRGFRPTHSRPRPPTSATFSKGSQDLAGAVELRTFRPGPLPRPGRRGLHGLVLRFRLRLPGSGVCGSLRPGEGQDRYPSDTGSVGSGGGHSLFGGTRDCEAGTLMCPRSFPRISKPGNSAKAPGTAFPSCFWTQVMLPTT